MRSYGHDEHMILYNPGPGKRKFDWEEANKLSTVHATRCAEGYGLDCSSNIKSQYYNNAWLQDMWKWMDDMSVAAEKGGMIVGRLDLSFIGIYSIWNNYLGPNVSSRLLEHPSQKPSTDEVDSAVTTLTARKNIAPFTGTKTSYPEHRALCEAINLSSLSPTDLSQLLQSFQTTWQHTKAASWALFHSSPSLAISALQSGPQHLQTLAIAIAASPFLASPPQAPTQQFRDVCTAAASKSSDPYTHALLSYLSTGKWESFLTSPNLPIRDRIACALRVLPDPSLTTFLTDLHATAISTGDITSLPLTGLSPPALPLFETYLRLTNDFPTAVLVLTHRPPATDVRFQAWQIHFTHFLHTSHLFHTLASYNQNATYLFPGSKRPSARQITLRCTTCSKPLTYAAPLSSFTSTAASTTPASALTSTTSTIPATSTITTTTTTTPTTTAPPTTTAATTTNPLSTPSSKSTPYTHCPTCNALLPRCAICRLHLGMPSTNTVSKAAEASRDDVQAKRMIFCAECKHGFHSKCAGEWFGGGGGDDDDGPGGMEVENGDVYDYDYHLDDGHNGDNNNDGGSGGGGGRRMERERQQQQQHQQKSNSKRRQKREECPVPDCMCLCGA